MTSQPRDPKTGRPMPGPVPRIPNPRMPDPRKKPPGGPLPLPPKPRYTTPGGPGGPGQQPGRPGGPAPVPMPGKPRIGHFGPGSGLAPSMPPKGMKKGGPVKGKKSR